MTSPATSLDAIVIGAGFGGMYALHHLRETGMDVRVYDGAGGVGGTWWWNRYPGARVDAPGSPFYCYTFSRTLVDGWDWQETQPTQAEVLRYLNFAADQLDLRRDIRLSTWITDARFDEVQQRWTIETSDGESASARFLICATGALTTKHVPDYPGIAEFAGETYHTGRWPHEPVSFEGKRVGVIGTGSSGVQAIPLIAAQAAHLTVFQRTPQYSLPAGNRPLTEAERRDARENWDHYRAMMLESPAGFPRPMSQRSAFDDTAEQRQATYETLWREGGFNFSLKSYRDILTDKAANDTAAEFVRGKIREIVDDAATARKLLPDYYFATKRLILDTDYFQTYNRDNVSLVDLREDPIQRFTARSIITTADEHPIDILVLATGFDAVTGSLLQLNPKGRGNRSLAEKWRERFDNYLGLTLSGFPNLFIIHGPGSPGVLYNMPLGAERQTEWIRDCIRHMDDNGFATVEPTADAETAWDAEIKEFANRTLYPLTDSWYTGSNIPGKPRQFLGHPGGGRYHQRIREISEAGFSGLSFQRRA